MAKLTNTFSEIDSAIKRTNVLTNSSPRVALCGDSITDDSESSGGFTDWGWGCWFRRYAGNSIQLEQGDIFAIASQGTDHLVNTQLPQVLAGGYDICITMIGTNDLGSAVGITANLETFYDALSDAGIAAIALPILPHGSPNSYTPNLAKEAESVNRWLVDRSYVDNNMMYVNLIDAVADFTTGDIVADYTRDGIHTNRVGAEVVGLAVYNALKPTLRTSNSNSVATSNSLYDASENPNASWLLNSFMVGSSGTLQNGAIGVAPDNWDFRRSSGAATYTLTGGKSIISGYGNLEAFNIAFSGTGDSNLMTLVKGGNVPEGVNTGDVIEFEMDVKFNNLVGVAWVALRATLGGNITTDGAETSSNGVAEYNTEVFKLRCRQIYSGQATFEIRVQAATVNGVALSGSIDVLKASVRKL